MERMTERRPASKGKQDSFRRAAEDRDVVAADIVATPENPLEKIDTVRHVSFVMKDGKVIRND
jgi:hypothetical protein